jgi:hypothetical protein
LNLVGTTAIVASGLAPSVLRDPSPFEVTPRLVSDRAERELGEGSGAGGDVNHS